MIVVISDDLTGGAEIAGIGLRYGMSVKLVTSVPDKLPDVELLVVALNTRSMSVQNAVNSIAQTVNSLKMLGVDEIFKKTDSVLRGHIVKELAAQIHIQKKSKVILCPANPQAGRKIVNGVYLINNVPIAKTKFALDPEYPVNTSTVEEILNMELLKTNKIKVIDACSEEDLTKAVQKKDRETILAGSAAFFNAYIKSLNYVPTTIESQFPNISKTLFVYGSSFNRNKQQVLKAKSSGTNIIYFSPRWIKEPEFENKLESCATKATQILKNDRRVILAIDKPLLRGKESAAKIKDAITKLVVLVLSKVSVNELFIEGGATSHAIIEALNFKDFTPIYEFKPGIVRLKINDCDGMFLTVKPGSYELPHEIWN